MHAQLIFTAEKLSHPTIAHKNQQSGAMYGYFMARILRKTCAKAWLTEMKNELQTLRI